MSGGDVDDEVTQRIADTDSNKAFEHWNHLYRIVDSDKLISICHSIDGIYHDTKRNIHLGCSISAGICKLLHWSKFIGDVQTDVSEWRYVHNAVPVNARWFVQSRNSSVSIGDIFQYGKRQYQSNQNRIASISERGWAA